MRKVKLFTWKISLRLCGSLMIPYEDRRRRIWEVTFFAFYRAILWLDYAADQFYIQIDFLFDFGIKYLYVLGIFVHWNFPMKEQTFWIV